jgi:hypothetical protein
MDWAIVFLILVLVFMVLIAIAEYVDEWKMRK